MLRFAVSLVLFALNGSKRWDVQVECFHVDLDVSMMAWMFPCWPPLEGHCSRPTPSHQKRPTWKHPTQHGTQHGNIQRKRETHHCDWMFPCWPPLGLDVSMLAASGGTLLATHPVPPETANMETSNATLKHSIFRSNVPTQEGKHNMAPPSTKMRKRNATRDSFIRRSGQVSKPNNFGLNKKLLAIACDAIPLTLTPKMWF